MEISDCKQMTAWLRTRESNVSVLIAARATLRVLPMLAADLRHVDGASFFRSQIVLPVFRVLAAAWTIVNYPELIDHAFAPGAADSGAAAEDAANAAVASNVATAARSTADAAIASDAATAARFRDETADVATAAGDAPDAAAGAVAAASAIYDGEIGLAFWEALSSDAARIADGESVFDVAQSPLWPDGQPLRGIWRNLRDHLLTANEDWQVWTGWYENRLTGGTRSWDHELVYARIPENFWNRGPSTVNGWIRSQFPSPRPGRP
jgi:hypothetical protein